MKKFQFSPEKNISKTYFQTRCWMSHFFYYFSFLKVIKKIQKRIFMQKQRMSYYIFLNWFKIFEALSTINFYKTFYTIWLCRNLLIFIFLFHAYCIKYCVLFQDHVSGFMNFSSDRKTKKIKGKCQLIYYLK